MKRILKTWLVLFSALLLVTGTAVTAFAEAAEETEEAANDGDEYRDEDDEDDEYDEDERTGDGIYTINGISFTADPELWEPIIDDDDFKSFISLTNENVFLIAGELYELFSEDPEELFSVIAGDDEAIAENLFPYDPDVQRTDYYTLNGLRCMSLFFDGEEGEYMELQAVENLNGEVLLMGLITLAETDAKDYMASWRRTALSVSPESDDVGTGSGSGVNTEGLDLGGNFRTFYWGDDIAFVADEEDAEARGADIGKKYITGLPVSVAGLPAEASFTFDDGLLVSGKYTLPASYEYGDEYVADYETLKAALIQVYGEPDREITKRVVEESTVSHGESLGEELMAGKIELYAVWHPADTEIQLGSGYRNDVLTTWIGFYAEEIDY